MALYVSDLLTATAAPVSAAPTSTRTWQWLRGSSAISGATSATYTAVTADIGSPLSASQIEANVAGTATATSAPTETVQAFDPIRLFSASEPGVWYDPSDVSTLFQDAAGTIPVTGPVGPAGQAISVGLMLDKSKGLVPGPDLVTNGSFATDTWWTKSGTTIAGGTANWAAAATSSWVGRTSGLLTVGAVYSITWTITEMSAGGLRLHDGSLFGPTRTAAGTYTELVRATGTNFYVISTGASTTASIDNISVKELPGNHATQATTASQPTYGIVPAGGRRNLLSFSEDFGNAVWQLGGGVVTKGTLSTDKPDGATGTVSTLAFPAVPSNYAFVYQQAGSLIGVPITFSVWLRVASGTGTIYLNVEDTMVAPTTANAFGSPALSLTTTWQRFTLTGTRTSGVGNATAVIGFDGRVNAGQTNAAPLTVQVWGAQLEQSATATPYQRVTTQYDVTEAGVASLGYLFFDGSGDFMSTGTITPGTDKAQVFMGLRKLSDASGYKSALMYGTWGSSNGSFVVYAPGFAGQPRYELGLRGSTNGGYGPQTFAAPITNVLTSLMDIGAATQAEELIPRINGVVNQSNPGLGSGTGSFGNYILYIGADNLAGSVFNGHLFPLIVRFGPNLTTARISATESWVASKTAGAPAL